MRKILGALFATLFALGSTSAALANCPHGHDKTKTEATEDQKTT